MKIRELTVQNYRPFKERPPFVFGEHFSVIAGVNGRGKTAVLDAIALCLTRLIPQITTARKQFRYLTPGDIHLDTSNAQTPKGSIEFGMKINCAGYPINNFNVSYTTNPSRIVGHEFIDDELKLKTTGSGLQNDYTHLSKQVCAQIKSLYSKCVNDLPSSPIAAYYTTDRAGFRRPKTLPTRAPQIRIAAAYSGALQNRMVNYRDFMARLHARLTFEATERQVSPTNPAFFGDRIISTIQNVLSMFLEGFSNLRVESRPLRLMVDKKDGERIVPLDLAQLSDGERSFLAMVCDLCRRLALANPELPDILQGQGVVLIDELELHLHPRWQREVVEKLRTTFPNIQFIVTTHSPFVVQTARAGEIVKLDGELAVEPAGRSIEEVARFVMGITNVNRSPRFMQMVETAHRYFDLAEQAKEAEPVQREAIRTELVTMLAPFTDNPAYTALLERRGMIEPEEPEETGGQDATG